MRHDAVIVGAGPAGATAARLLAAAGWKIALVEKAGFPRRKVCGEFMSAAAMGVLEDCGIADSFLAAAGPPVTRLGAYAGTARLHSPRQQVWGRALGREHLDVLLRDAAVAAGAELFQPVEVTSLTRQGDGFVCVLESGAAISARHVIAAPGSWNPKGIFALPSPLPRPADLFAFKAHFRQSRLPPGLMPLLAFPGGYGGLVESDAGRVSLSCCIRRDALALARARHGGKAGDAVLAHIQQTTSGVKQALEQAVMEGVVLATGPIYPGTRAAEAEGVFFTGNIAGEAHPVIAEGISMAIQSSGLLAQLLIAGRGEDYAAAWKQRFALRIRAAALFAGLAMRAPAAGLRLLRAAPGLLDVGARMAGKV